PGPARPAGPAVRRAAALRRSLAPGTGARRARPGLPAPGGVLGVPGPREAQVPGRIRVRHGRVRQRRAARDHRPATEGGRTMKLLVTGGAGYIGSVVAALLAEAGHAVTVLDDLPTGHRDAVPEGASFTEASVVDAAAVLDPSYDAVLHFAAKSLVG